MTLPVLSVASNSSIWPRAKLWTPAYGALLFAWAAFVGSKGIGLIESNASQLNPLFPFLPPFAATILVVLVASIVCPRLWLSVFLPATVATIAVAFAIMSGMILAVATSLAILVAAFGVGSLVVRPIGNQMGFAEQFVVPTTFGLGALSLIILVIGLAQAIFIPVLFAVLAVLGLAYWRFGAPQSAWSQLKNSASLTWNCSPDRFKAALFSLLALIFLINFVQCLAPEIQYDALKSHLAIARIFSESHAVEALPYSMGTYWPMGAELLYTVAYSLGGEVAAKMVHFEVGILAAGQTYILGKFLRGQVAGIVALALFYSIPIIDWESTTAYIDLFLTLYAAAAAVQVIAYVQRRQKRHLFRCAVALGFALGIKPSAGFLCVGCGLIILAHWPIFRSIGARFIAALQMAAVTLLVGGGWYLRAYLLTGNPVFPFLNGLFQSPLWYPQNENFNYSIYGMGASLNDLAILPWNLTFHTDHFGEVPAGAVGLVLLAGAPVAVFLLKSERRNSAICVTLVFCFSIGWVASAQYLRYLMPIFPILSALIAAGFIQFRQGLLKVFPHAVRLSGFAFLALLAFGVPLNLLQFWNVPTRIPIAVDLGLESRVGYVTQIHPELPVFQYINREENVASFRAFSGREFFQFFSDAPLVTPFFTIDGNKILEAKSETGLLGDLRASGIDHILIDRPAMGPDFDSYLVASPGFLDRFGTLLFAANGVYWYELNQDGSKYVANPNAGRCVEKLQDATFSSLGTGAKSQWIGFGMQSEVPNRSKDGMVATVPGVGISQMLASVAGDTYTLKVNASSSAKDSWASLELVWLDQDGSPLAWNIEVLSVPVAGKSLFSSATAPVGSMGVTVELTAYRGQVNYSQASLCGQRAA